MGVHHYIHHASLRFYTSSYLQVCSPLKGLVAEAADVAAVLAVSLSAVAPQRVGVLTHLITVVTLVPIISVHLAILPVIVAFVSHLNHTHTQ